MQENNIFTQNEHYIPQFYLKYFASESGLILVTDKIKENTYEASPRSICVIKDLYEIKKPNKDYIERNTIEKALSQYEGFLDNVLRKLMNRCDNEESPFMITGEEDAALAFFLALQLVRQPETKKKLCEIYNKGITTGLTPIDREALYLINALHNKKRFVDNLITDLSDILHPYTQFLIQEDQTLLESIMSHVLSNCYFSVIVPKNDTMLYTTCDNPIVKNTPFIDALYLFSLSPKHMVIVSEFETLNKNHAERKLWAEDATVKRVNELIYGNATRFIFSKE